MGDAAKTLAPETAQASWSTVAPVAARYGFSSSRMFLRWCRRYGVEVRGEGKVLFVAPAAVERTIAELPSRGRRQETAPRTANDTDDAVARTVAAVMGRR